MTVIRQFIELIAKNGNCTAYIPSKNENENFVMTVDVSDKQNMFMASINKYDETFWDGNSVNKSASVIKREFLTSSYNVDDMYTIVAYLVDNAVFNDSQGFLLTSLSSDNQYSEDSAIMADELAFATSNALNIYNYDLFDLIKKDINERVDVFANNMWDYENENYGNSFIEKVDMEDIKEISIKLDLIDLTIVLVQNRIEYLYNLLDKIGDSTSIEEEIFYTNMIDDFCGGNNYIVHQSDKKARTKELS